MHKLKLKLLLSCFLLTVAAAVWAQPVPLNEKTLGGIFFNAGSFYELYCNQLEELAKPENSKQLEEVNSQANSLLKTGSFDLREHIEEFKRFKNDGFFVPEGSIWFSIDEKYRPLLVCKARCKPEDFYRYIFTTLGEPVQLKAAKTGKDLVEIQFPTPQFKVILQIATDSVKLFSDEKVDHSATTDFWQKMMKEAAGSETILDLQIDFNVVKRLLAQRLLQSRHSQCLGNLMAVKNAVEMYQIETGELMESLDMSLLTTKHYLADSFNCDQGGKYELSQANGLKVSCSVHGSIEHPISVDSEKSGEVDPRLKPFETLRLEVKKGRIHLAMQISDKNLLDQWEAIGKQQLLTIKHMAQNQMGNLPKEQKDLAVKIAESIKCSSENDWLKLDVGGFDQKMLVSSIIGLIETLRQTALPKFKKAREFELKKETIEEIKIE